jgi:glucose/mannose-6-phosphate isomerase
MLLQSVLAEAVPFPVELLGGYSCPAALSREDLLLVVSYSGNTGEALNMVTQAEKKGVPMVFITSGGKLAQLAEKNGISCVALPAGYQPRAALGLLLAPQLYIFEKLGFFPRFKEELEETLKVLEELRAENKLDVPAKQNEAKKLAAKIFSTIPLIYGSDRTYAAAYRFKSQLNENAKMLAHAAAFTEANHNEIEGLYNLKRGGHNFSAVFLRGENDDEKTKKQMDITKSLVGAQVGGVGEALSRGKSSLARLLSLAYFLDLVSVYIALLRGVDPAEIKAIPRLKKEMLR